MSNLVLITGNTYPVKDQIKALGGRWDAANKGWRVSEDQAEAARALVAGAPKSSYSPRRSSGGSSGYGRGFSRRRRNEDDECELCGRNKYTCGHCIGW